MMKRDPGAVGFTGGFSQEKLQMVGKQLRLAIDRRTNNYDGIQGNDHDYRHHVQD